MEKDNIKTCAKCGQQLRLPKDIGGMLMECPSCGHTFGSDFRLGGVRKVSAREGLPATIFNAPYRIACALYRRFFSR